MNTAEHGLRANSTGARLQDTNLFSSLMCEPFSCMAELIYFYCTMTICYQLIVVYGRHLKILAQQIQLPSSCDSVLTTLESLRILKNY